MVVRPPQGRDSLIGCALFPPNLQQVACLQLDSDGRLTVCASLSILGNTR